MKISAAALRFAALATMTTALFSQAPPINFQSTTINADHTITFRYKDPAATKINLVIRDLTKPIPMTKGADGVWTATSPPLAPAIYNYYFDADGQWRYDPANPHVAIKFQNVTNLLTVTGDTPQIWEPMDVPHGEVHQHYYTSKVVLHLPNNQSEYYVYTPPGYDPKGTTRYPVLYLLHGFNEGPYTWTQVGRANYILDNLIAQGKAKPMIVVMPLGYGDLDYVTHARNQATSAEQTKRFPQALLTEILPQVEAQYHVLRDRDHRAIAGLSMGGQESLTIGLTNTDKFAYVIGLSSAAQGIPNNPALANLNPKSANLKLLWVSCGTEDSLSEPNHKLVDWLKSKGMDVHYVQTPGVHSWIVWQDNLAHFAPLLFQSTASAQIGSNQSGVLAQMDASSRNFHSAEADVKREQYDRLVHDTTTQSGSVYFLRNGSAIQMGAKFNPPSAQVIEYKNGTLRIYSPETNHVETRVASGADQTRFQDFLTLGFGGTGSDLEKAWIITDQGSEAVEGVKAQKLNLVSKDPSVRNNFSHITLWIDPVRDISLKQEFFDPAGNTNTVTYTNIRYNQPIRDLASYEIKCKGKCG